MKILSDEEIEDIKPVWDEEYGTARAIEAKVIEKLKELLKKERREGLSSRDVHRALFKEEA